MVLDDRLDVGDDGRPLRHAQAPGPQGLERLGMGFEVSALHRQNLIGHELQGTPAADARGELAQ